MYYIIKCIVQGKQARVKNADLRPPSLHSCNVKTQICVTRPQFVKSSFSSIIRCTVYTVHHYSTLC